MTDIYLTHNGSSEANIEYLKSQFPKINHLIQNPNIGYAGGVNFSFRTIFNLSIVDWIYFFSNDTTLKSLPSALPKTPALYAPTSFRRQGTFLDSVGGVFIPYRAKVFHAKSKAEFYKNKITYIPGSAYLVHREVFIKTGGTDEKLFCYFEDIDWSMRIRKSGGNLEILDDFITTHGIGKTTRKDSFYTFYLFNRNCRIISRRYTPLWQRPVLELILFWKFLNLFYYLLKKQRFSELKSLPGIF